MGDSAWNIMIPAISGLVGALTASIIPIILNKKATKAEIAEKYSSLLSGAIEHLNTNQEKNAMHIRIGAIYELERLAEDSPRDRERIIKILTRFIEDVYPSKSAENAPEPPKDILVAVDVLQALVKQEIESVSPKGIRLAYWKVKRKLYHHIALPSPKSCCFKAMEVIFHVPCDRNEEERFIKWQNIRAQSVDLCGINLTRADLLGARLQGACLRSAFLESACLGKAQLQNAELECAGLENAYLDSARLKGAFLWAADLENANLFNANIQRAQFGADIFSDSTYLSGACLYQADLRHATGLTVGQLAKVDIADSTLLPRKLRAEYDAYLAEKKAAKK